MRTVLIFILHSVLCWFASSEIRSYRLPTDVIPNHYSIKIHPDIDNEVFEGEVTIYVRTKNILNKITLHSSQLNITDAFMNKIRCKVVYENDEKISLQYDNDSIQAGEYVLHMKYNGVLRKKGSGFLKAPFKYKEHQGFVLVTDLEPVSARKVFPCFDEPSFKAKFNIRLIAPNDTYQAISNMPEINKFTTSKGIVYDFATTLKMSTYLVSFALTQYTYYEEKLEEIDREVPIRIYTYNASKANNEEALGCAKRALKFYSEYTNISYPLSKLDMIEYNRAESVATENWGLITFREGILTGTLGLFDIEQIKLVVYHELSHFWFGNLVTNDWWDDIWLQEGFATYMSYKLYSKEIPPAQKMRVKEFFFNEFFETDIENDTKPIVEYLASLELVTARFDETIYNKGAAMLSMIEDVIGEEAFQKVVRKYLKDHAYGTATTNDFISTIEEIVPTINIRDFIESYIYQNRFPLVSVSQENGTFILKQEVCKTVAKISDYRQRWTIPITYITNNVKTPTHVWFDKDMDSLKINVPDAKWLLLNSHGIGMYKVNFSEKSWKILADNYQELSSDEVSVLVSNAFYSYRFDVTNCHVMFNLMKQVKSYKHWTYFFLFHELIVERLKCNDYKKELDIYMSFLYQKFNETDYPKRPKIKDRPCLTGEGILENEEQTENLKECALWITENLSVTSIKSTNNDLTNDVAVK